MPVFAGWIIFGVVVLLLAVVAKGRAKVPVEPEPAEEPAPVAA